ncbi:MAG TPA: hypothetical protein VMG10_27445 [Gemmataceae bacterium]|nr:hypothetical protein [Gemmataceae bacterium]
MFHKTPSRRPQSAPTTKRKQTRRASRAELGELRERVLSLPAAQLREHLEGLVGRPEVADAQMHIGERRFSAERYPERNAAIRQQHAKKHTYGELALDFGLSRAAIAKIVQRGRRKSVDMIFVSTAKAS